jgi:hypothetical protein
MTAAVVASGRSAGGEAARSYADCFHGKTTYILLLRL